MVQVVTHDLEQKTQETADGLAKLKLAEEKWQEERDQMKHTIEELRRHNSDAERKMKVLQEQHTETNSRYDNMINEMKSQGNGEDELF